MEAIQLEKKQTLCSISINKYKGSKKRIKSQGYSDTVTTTLKLRTMLEEVDAAIDGSGRAKPW